jgi:hypothetical protein
MCDDGSTGSYECESTPNGCGYVLVCGGGGDGETCTLEACGRVPEAAPRCDDGSLGEYECQSTAYGCGYELVCGDQGGGSDGGTDGQTDACDADACGPAPAIARICDDGSTADQVCQPNEDGECAWAYPCE